MSDDVNFTELLCPLLDRVCEKEKCVAFNQWFETYYEAGAAKETILEAKLDKDKSQTYHILEVIVNEQVDQTRQFCKQYNEEYVNIIRTPIQETTIIHGERISLPRYKGGHLSVPLDIRCSETLVPNRRGWVKKDG